MGKPENRKSGNIKHEEAIIQKKRRRKSAIRKGMTKECYGRWRERGVERGERLE